MVLLQGKKCIECGDDYFATLNDGGVCTKCIRLKEEALKKEHMDSLKELTLEERIERLEENEYDRSKNYRTTPNLIG